MNWFARLTSKMTSSSTLFLLLLVIGSPGPVTSDGTSVEVCLNEALAGGQKEWTTDSSLQIIQINWNFDKVCVSVEQCYGNGSAIDLDFIKIHQLPPVQVQPNQFVAFRSEKVRLEYLSVNELDFEKCGAEGGQWLDVENDTVLGVANGQLTRGNNYFIANSANGTLQWKCSPYGLRLNITVQPHNCSQDSSSSSSLLCSGHGRCLARRYEPYYNCHCCQGYLGGFCEKKDGCVNVTCQHGGTCLDGPDDVGLGPAFTCSCIPGFTGTYCENLEGEICPTNECMYNGICLLSDSELHFRCVCQLGYTGKVCETNVDECASSPCHNGLCNDAINGYTCTCYEDYSGVNCETYIGLCPVGRCKNGAICEPDRKNKVATCLCSAGYTGISCETQVELCNSNPCVNSIDCVDYGDKYRCVCLPGYTGANCEVDVDECASNPCHNGGTCHDKLAAFLCDCPEDLPQPMCGVAPENSTDIGGKGGLGAVGLTIVAAVLGCLFGIAVVVLIVYCCVVRKPYKLLRPKKYIHIVDETYGPSNDVTGAHPSPDFISDTVSDTASLSTGSAKSPLVRRVKHNEPDRI